MYATLYMNTDSVKQRDIQIEVKIGGFEVTVLEVNVMPTSEGTLRA